MSIHDFEIELRNAGYEPLGTIEPTESWKRLAYNGEKRSESSGSYKLKHNADGSYFGVYGSQKDPLNFRTWISSGRTDMNWDEIAAAKLARDEHREHLVKMEQRKHDRTADRLKKAVQRMPLATEHPYLLAKGIKPHGARFRAKTGELIIPRTGTNGKMYSIQKIRLLMTGKFWKSYLKGGRSTAVYFTMATTDDDRSMMVVCEGFATGASIREATGMIVVVAFDSNGIVSVAKALREKYPKVRLFIAADSDQWVMKPGKRPADYSRDIPGDDPRWKQWREDGLMYNPGVEKARKAAEAVDGVVVIPDLDWSHPKKLTDFNDMASEYGLDRVRQIFDNAKEIRQVPVVPVDEGVPSGFSGRFDSDVHPSGDADKPDRKIEYGDMGLNFRVLGYNHGEYFYYPFGMRQIVTLAAAQHSMQNLLQLDSLASWEKGWKNEAGKLMVSHSQIALAGGAAMMQMAEKRGVFLEEDRCRGAGAWIDDSRVVLHCGDTLYVDGAMTPFGELKTEFTYVASQRLMRLSAEPLTNQEAARLRKICESVTWDNKLSGTLLSGWLVIAPICAALQYRPHVYITGEAESGKSTVMERIVKPVLGKLALKLDGGTTEPAVRNTMGYDGRPLVFDEAEPSPEMDGVIKLARKASTGSIVAKFGQRAYKARFCACFSAINPPVSKTADETRHSFMHIKKNMRITAMQEYDQLLTMIEDTITDDFSDRLLARTLENMNSLLGNIRVFQRAVRKVIGGARASQQIGTMLAGVYMLGRTDVISLEDAEKWVQQHNWSDHTVVGETTDPLRLVQHITSSMVRYLNGEVAISDLISMVHNDKDSRADKFLRHYGISVKEERVIIANRSANFSKILRETDWKEKWNRTLLDVEGAEKIKIAYFSPEIKTSAVSLPVGLFIENPYLAEITEEENIEEIPF